MGEKINVYYDITAWESLELEDNMDELKDRCQKICSKLGDDLGIMSFVLRTDQIEEPVEVPAQPEGVKDEQQSSN